jgi:ribosomal protein S18 acetylase RimI-like enzyme
MEIIRLEKLHRHSLFALYRQLTARLRREGIDQWDWIYPNRWTIHADVKNGRIYGIVKNGRVIGAISMDRRLEARASMLSWADVEGDPWAIHRLAVHPDEQGKGIGSRLLRYGEALISDAGGTSIRLEVYQGNPGAVALYRRAGYVEVGEVRFPFRKLSYICFEKNLKSKTVQLRGECGIRPSIIETPAGPSFDGGSL